MAKVDGGRLAAKALKAEGVRYVFTLCEVVMAPYYEGCEADHIGCLVNKLADEVERQNAVIDKLVKEIEENDSSPCMGHLR